MKQELICGDSLDVMREMKSGSIDIVCTSPPYNIKNKYNKYKDNLPKEDYLKWMRNVFIEIKRILKNNGSFFLNICSKNKEPLLIYEIVNEFKDIFIIQNDIIWVKSICIGDDPNMSFGHYKPVNSDRFLHKTYEKIFHLTKNCDVKVDALSIGLPYKWKCNRKNRKTGTVGVDLRSRGDSWFVKYETIQNKKERFYHPAPFPVILPEYCIKFHGIKKGMVVLDPFVGIGGTLIACKKLGIHGIGIDMDEKYCEDSKKRLMQYDKKKDKDNS